MAWSAFKTYPVRHWQTYELPLFMQTCWQLFPRAHRSPPGKKIDCFINWLLVVYFHPRKRTTCAASPMHSCDRQYFGHMHIAQHLASIFLPSAEITVLLYCSNIVRKCLTDWCMHFQLLKKRGISCELVPWSASPTKSIFHWICLLSLSLSDSKTCVTIFTINLTHCPEFVSLSSACVPFQFPSYLTNTLA